MKINRTIKITFRTLEQVEAAFGQAIENEIPSRQPRDVVYFQTSQWFRNFMTLQKIEFIGLIAYSKPGSIYALSKMASRPLSAVRRDCNALAGLRFIKLRKKKAPRGSIVPTLKFDYNKIIVQLPEHPYCLKIEDAS